MKAFKIDPKNKTIKEIVIDRWQDIYQIVLKNIILMQAILIYII